MELQARKVYRMKELVMLLGVSKETIYYWIRKGSFPRPIKLGTRISGWLGEDILKWIDERKGYLQN